MRRPPTVKELLAVLDKSTIRVVARARVNGRPVRGYCDDTHITIGKALHPGKFDEMVLTTIHELCHVRDELKEDHRFHHDKIPRWEVRLGKSHALCGAVAVRLGNAVLFGDGDP